MRVLEKRELNRGHKKNSKSSTKTRKWREGTEFTDWKGQPSGFLDKNTSTPTKPDPL